MSAVTNMWRQLVQRRLWPVAILLIAALAAVPLTLAKEPEAPSNGSPVRPRKPPRGSLSPATKWSLRLASLVAITVAWELYGSAINPILLSSPTAIIGAAFEMVADGFLSEAHRSMAIVGEDGGTLLDRLAGYVPPRTEKWLDRGGR